jgi:hypothetical protein
LIPNRIHVLKIWNQEILSIRQLWKEEPVKMKHPNKGKGEVEENYDFYDFFQTLRPRKVILDTDFLLVHDRLSYNWLFTVTISGATS